MDIRLVEISIISAATSFAALCVCVFLPFILYTSLKKRIFDTCEERKVDSNIRTCRLGGVVFLPAIAAICALTIVLVTQFEIIPITGLSSTITLQASAILIMYCVGLYDDIMGVKYIKKFAYQFIMVTLLVVGGIYIDNLGGFLGIYEISPLFGIPVTFFLVIFITNAINLIDGIDGLSSSLSIMAFLIMGTIFFLQNNFVYALTSFVTLGVLCSFCYKNIFGLRKNIKTKIIMGDTGTLVIGSILSIFAIKIWNTSADAITTSTTATVQAMVISVLLIPCLDVVRVVLRRYRDNQPLFKADKNHFHHKLLAMGLTKHQALLVIVFCNILFIIVNYILSGAIPILCMLLIDIAIWTIMHIFITAKVRRKNQIQVGK